MSMIEPRQCNSAQEVFANFRRTKAVFAKLDPPKRGFWMEKCESLELRLTEANQRSTTLEQEVKRLQEIIASLESEVVKEAVLALRPGPVTLDRIIAVCCAYYGISKQQVMADKRDGEIVHCRHVIFYLARRLTKLSMPQIGKRIGDRDHTTVHHAVKRVELRFQDDPDVKKEIEHLLGRLINEPVNSC